MTNRINPDLWPVGMAWDAAGNQTVSGGYLYTYDAENRLTTSTLNGVTAYQYDGTGDGWLRVDCLSGTNPCVPTSTAATTTWYVYDANGGIGGGVFERGHGGAVYDLLSDGGSFGKHSGDDGRERNPVQCHDYLPFGEEIEAGSGGVLGAMERRYRPECCLRGRCGMR